MFELPDVEGFRRYFARYAGGGSTCWCPRCQRERARAKVTAAATAR